MLHRSDTRPLDATTDWSSARLSDLSVAAISSSLRRTLTFVELLGEDVAVGNILTVRLSPCSFRSRELLQVYRRAPATWRLDCRLALNAEGRSLRYTCERWNVSLCILLGQTQPDSMSYLADSLCIRTETCERRVFAVRLGMRVGKRRCLSVVLTTTPKGQPSLWHAGSRGRAGRAILRVSASPWCVQHVVNPGGVRGWRDEVSGMGEHEQMLREREG